MIQVKRKKMINGTFFDKGSLISFCTYIIMGGFMNDSLFKRVEKKTNVNKETIKALASKLQNGNMKNKSTLLEVIDELSLITGKEISNEKKEKIINAIINDKVPNNIENNF